VNGAQIHTFACGFEFDEKYSSLQDAPCLRHVTQMTDSIKLTIENYIQKVVTKEGGKNGDSKEADKVSASKLPQVYLNIKVSCEPSEKKKGHLVFIWVMNLYVTFSPQAKVAEEEEADDAQASKATKSPSSQTTTTATATQV